MKKHWKKILIALCVCPIVYLLLIASLYIFPSSSQRIADVTNLKPRNYGLNLIDHLIMSMPIEEEYETINDEFEHLAEWGKNDGGYIVYHPSCITSLDNERDSYREFYAFYKLKDKDDIRLKIVSALGDGYWFSCKTK